MPGLLVLIAMVYTPLICFILGWGWSMLIAAREEEYFWVFVLFLFGILSPIYCLTQWEKAQIAFLMTAIPIGLWGLAYVYFSHIA